MASPGDRYRGWRGHTITAFACSVVLLLVVAVIGILFVDSSNKKLPLSSVTRSIFRPVRGRDRFDDLRGDADTGESDAGRDARLLEIASSPSSSPLSSRGQTEVVSSPSSSPSSSRGQTEVVSSPSASPSSSRGQTEVVSSPSASPSSPRGQTGVVSSPSASPSSSRGQTEVVSSSSASPSSSRGQIEVVSSPSPAPVSEGPAGRGRRARAPFTNSRASSGGDGEYDPKDHWTVVTASGTQFVTEDGLRFYVCGWNDKHLLYNGVTTVRQERVKTAFTQAMSLGLNVVRMVVVISGIDNALQTGPTTFNEDALKGLDWVINEASARGIRLLVCFSSNWDIKASYLGWLKPDLDTDGDQSLYDDFYREPMTRGWYKGLIRKVVTRRNTITGLIYSSDPTVFAWELMNEARCGSDKTSKTLLDWYSEMARYVKSLDSSHMVSTGSDAFYGPSRSDRLWINPAQGWPAEQGGDYIEENLISNIDFAAAHIYPQLWMGHTVEDRLEFFPKWIKGHIDDNKWTIKKPMVFEEFGWMGSVKLRTKMFSSVYNYSYHATTEGGISCGTMFWTFGKERNVSSDWNVDYQRHSETIDVIREHCADLNRLPR